MSVSPTMLKVFSYCIFSAETMPNKYLLNVYCVSDSMSAPVVGRGNTALVSYICLMWRFPSRGRKRKNYGVWEIEGRREGGAHGGRVMQCLWTAIWWRPAEMWWQSRERCSSHLITRWKWAWPALPLEPSWLNERFCAVSLCGSMAPPTPMTEQVDENKNILDTFLLIEISRLPDSI